MTMDTKVILVCLDNDDRKIYLNALASLNVSVEVVSSFRELQGLLIETPYHGVMVDLKTKIRSLKNERELAYEILYRYPVVQLRLDDETGEIRTLSDGKSRHDATLEEFIESDCRPFEARAIRSSPRVLCHFNVLLSSAENFVEADAERTITFNISKGGCFIISSRPWELNKLVSFQILDLKDTTPITGEIRWNKPWGRSLGIPGIGVQFLEITDVQLKEISKKGRFK